MIKSLKIKNFKSIYNITVKFNPNFNVIIGENNIGKTTLFEAILLWKMCYDDTIKKSKKGFYAQAHNLLFRDMEHIRVYQDMDLFPHNYSKKDAEAEITLEIEYNGISYRLGFRLEKVDSMDDAYYQTKYIDYSEFEKFAEMVNSIPGKNLSNFIMISETRPIANIIAKEPYMYKAQVMDKIAKGKGYEVLRNKIKDNILNVQEHINNVMGKDYQIVEKQKDDKTYISIKVDGKNIFSYGSGFLQLAEIFSSLEYVEPEIYLLLIDEPDSHLHAKLQRRLINELRTLTNSQLLIISHNDRFLKEVDEEEILFMTESAKENGIVDHLPAGYKGIVLENLVGDLEDVEKLRNARKLILVEGVGDIDFLDTMCPKYEEYANVSFPMKIVVKMDGIDTLNAKLITYSRALKGIIPTNCKWLLIRDTDCVPCNKKESAGNVDKKNVDTSGAEFKVFFQNGYGIESTFAAEPDKLAKLLCSYYSLENSEDVVENIIMETNAEYFNKVKDVLNVEVHQELEKHYKRQKEARSGKIYDNLQFTDMLKEISATNIQYIMTKPIMDRYLESLHAGIVNNFSNISAVKLDHRTIFTYYYQQISCLDDMFESHKALLQEIYRD
ncbi:ATP-dependent nuclease [Mediterraneibacter sp. 210702-DFI.5.30]|uniref:ATP-dependent nuclease n=1 Tax=Mediterraneibacter sp. 210702-DFI.5.30 TaxID=2883232 RepID=UPI001D08B4BE|nr:ATP-binding protein [Mediterraneibacter sp. 210702-DFI.5.30]MCB6622297.1 AAA family ATPase [Mediterraneibacter sp. 210702-DFI.5.30]